MKMLGMIMAVVIISAGCAFAVAQDVVDFHNLTCPVSGHPASQDYVAMYNNVQYHFCSPADADAFTAAPEQYLVELPNNGQVIDLQNTVCPVMDGGAAVAGEEVIYNGQKVHFCCGGCQGEFMKDPEKYLQKITQ